MSHPDPTPPLPTDADDPFAGLPSLPGPNQLGADQLWRTPALPSAGGPDEVKIRLLRREGRLIVHVTAPDPEKANAIVRELFGPDQEVLIEMCG